MRSVIRSLVVGLALLLAPGSLHAQLPGNPPWVGTLADPAYRHFLNSPYSYRTFSTASPGYAAGYPTPFGYQSFYATPGYRNERITPYGYQSYYSLPGYGGATLTPFGGSFYRVPRTVRRTYVPYVPRPYVGP